MNTRTLRLPIKHAQDWASRYDGDEDGGPGIIECTSTSRTITLTMTETALRDMISDALYYSEEMDPSNTGDIDYRPPAKTLLRALDRLGVKYTRGRFYSVTLEG